MRQDPMISVIVPIYNVEPYLDKCIGSIVNQSYKNLEIILVDDGSPDRCPEICDQWATRDNRIRVIHKENGGLSNARNAGLAVATGELIGFVDSDDWITQEMYQLLYDNMVKCQSDIAACGVEMVWENGKEPCVLTKQGSSVMDNREAMYAVVEEKWIQAPVWYKLYKAELVKDIFFPVGKYHEDVFWTYQVVAKAKKVSVFDTICYYYVQRANSIMGTDYSIKRLDALEAKVCRLDYYKKYYPEFAEKVQLDLFYYCLWSGQSVLRYLCGPERRQGLKICKDAYKQLNGLMPHRVKDICWVLLSRVSFRGTIHLRKLLRIGL